jgi:predicted ester cyclase
MTHTTDLVRTEANKALLREYLEGFWTRGDDTVADRSIAADAVFHDFADSPVPLPQGLAGVKAVRHQFSQGFPSLVMAVDDLVAEGDTVVVRWTVTGVHEGEFQGLPPTYRAIDFGGTTHVRVVAGKVVEGWQHMDLLKGMQQLGIVPAGPPPAPMRWFVVARTWLEQRRRRA